MEEQGDTPPPTWRRRRAPYKSGVEEEAEPAPVSVRAKPRKKRASGGPVRSSEQAHEVGGGFGGLFDFDKAADSGASAVDVRVEHVGVGGDDAEKIVEGVGNDLGLVRIGGGVIRGMESVANGRSFSKVDFGFAVRDARKNGRVEGFRSESVNRDTAGSANLFGFNVEVADGIGVKSEYGKRRIFGANLFDVVEALEVPSVNIEDGGVPLAASQNEQKLVERDSSMKFESNLRSICEGLRKQGPGRVFPQEQNLKNSIEH